MAKKLATRRPKATEKPAEVDPSPAGTPAPSIPIGGVPLGTPMSPKQGFPPEVAAALQNARDNHNGRWAIAIFTADEPGKEPHNVRFQMCRGGNWSDDWFVRAHRLFVAENLKPPEPPKPQPPAPPAVVGEVANATNGLSS